MKKGNARELLVQVPGWELSGDGKQIFKEWKCKNFKEALAFVNKVGEIAESEGHHPNIYVHGWNKVKLELSTHAIGGLTENDFIMAAKINGIIK